jgi:hypothetical protein
MIGVYRWSAEMFMAALLVCIVNLAARDEGPIP